MENRISSYFGDEVEHSDLFIALYPLSGDIADPNSTLVLKGFGHRIKDGVSVSHAEYLIVRELYTLTVSKKVGCELVDQIEFLTNNHQLQSTFEKMLDEEI
jgi:hypothetical protein